MQCYIILLAEHLPIASEMLKEEICFSCCFSKLL